MLQQQGGCGAGAGAGAYCLGGRTHLHASTREAVRECVRSRAHEQMSEPLEGEGTTRAARLELGVHEASTRTHTATAELPLCAANAHESEGRRVDSLARSTSGGRAARSTQRCRWHASAALPTLGIHRSVAMVVFRLIFGTVSHSTITHFT